MRQAETGAANALLCGGVERLQIGLVDRLHALGVGLGRRRLRILARSPDLHAIEHRRIARDLVRFLGPQHRIGADEGLFLGERGIRLQRVDCAIGDGEAAPALLVIGALADAFEQARFEQAIVPHAVEIVGAVARRAASAGERRIDPVAAFVVGIGDVERLMNVADPMAELHQREGAVGARLGRVLQQCEIARDAAQDAIARAGAGLFGDRGDGACDVDEMVVGVAPRDFVFLEAGIVERGVMLGGHLTTTRDRDAAVSTLQQVTERGARGWRQVAVREITDGQMAELAPGLRLLRLRDGQGGDEDDGEQGEQTAHGNSPRTIRQRQPLTPGGA